MGDNYEWLVMQDNPSYTGAPKRIATFVFGTERVIQGGLYNKDRRSLNAKDSSDSDIIPIESVRH